MVALRIAKRWAEGSGHPMRARDDKRFTLAGAICGLCRGSCPELACSSLARYGTLDMD